MAAYQTSNFAYQGAGQFVYQTDAGVVIPPTPTPTPPNIRPDAFPSLGMARGPKPKKREREKPNDDDEVLMAVIRAFLSKL